MRRALVIALSALLGLAPVQPPAAAQPDVPIIDLHFHAQNGWNVGSLVQLFDQLGVARAGSGPAGEDSLGLSFGKSYPNRFFSFGGQGSLVGLIWREGSQIWTLQSPDVNRYLDRLEVELRSRQVRGIGEVFVNNLNSHPADFKPIRMPGDSPLMRRLWDLSARYHVPLQVHAEADAASIAELERLMSSDSQGTLLWAHTGFYAGPSDLRQLLQQHPNLFCELSWRDERPARIAVPISEARTLKPDWKALLEEFSDRFVVGTDVGGPSPVEYSRLIGYWRQILNQLSPEARARLAHQNAERILGLSESK